MIDEKDVERIAERLWQDLNGELLALNDEILNITELNICRAWILRSIGRRFRKD